MDIAKSILTQPVSPPMPLENSNGTPIVKWQRGEIDGFSEDEKKQIAKDFESVLLNKLMDEMKNTIGSWGFDKDGASSQVQGIFWLYLARDIANNGGIGLWKDIYQFLNDTNESKTTIKSLDRNV